MSKRERFSFMAGVLLSIFSGNLVQTLLQEDRFSYVDAIFVFAVCAVFSIYMKKSSSSNPT